MLAVVLGLFARTKFNGHQGTAGEYYKGAASQGLDRQGDGNGKRLMVKTNRCSRTIIYRGKEESIFKHRAGRKVITLNRMQSKSPLQLTS